MRLATSGRLTHQHAPVLAAICMMMGCATTTSQSGGSGVIVGSTPEFSLPNVEGQPVELSSLRGKVVIIDFWASWCAPCKVAMPFYDGLQRDHPEALVVVGVSVDEEAEAMRAALEQLPVSFTILHDQQGQVAEQFGVDTMPSSYVLDSNGKVARIHRGFVVSDSDSLRQEIETLIAAQ